MKLLLNVLILCLLLLSSCGISKSKNIETAAQPTNSSGYTIKSNTFTKTNDEEHYVIKYPIIQGKGFEKSNKLIKAYLQNLYIFNDADSRQNVQMDYHLSFQNPSVISIVFEGVASVDDIREDLFLTLNVNLKNGTMIKLSDLYTLNEGFKNIYFETAKKQVPKKFANDQKDWIKLIEGYKKHYNKEVDEEFSRDDEYYYGIQSYLTPNGIGLILYYPNERQNYETVIPYTKIKPYLKTNKPIEIPPVN